MREASHTETIVFICFIVCLCVGALIFCFRLAMVNQRDYMQWLRTRDPLTVITPRDNGNHV